MPNTPALVGAGYTAICEEHTFNKAALAWAKELFSTLGMVQVLPERLFDAVVAVSGSSPAYVYMFIDAMADGAVRLGMPRKMPSRQPRRRFWARPRWCWIRASIRTH